MNEPKSLRWSSRALCALAFVAALFILQSAGASTWAGGNGNWSSDASPGWNGTGVPNAAGAVAQNTNAGNVGATTVVDVPGGVTIGTLSLGATRNANWGLTLLNPITLNQDGAGAGAATIVNSAAGTFSRISIGSGTFTLADDLVISNTSASTATSSISISSVIGGVGNLTLYNVSNDAAAGPIALTGASTFTGSVLVAKGVVTFSTTGQGLGYVSNAVTLGSVGNGSASLLVSGTTASPGNNITVVSGTGGTLLLGATDAGSTTNSFNGVVTLNGDLSVTSSKTGAGVVRFMNTISGAGGLTKVGTGRVTLNTNDTYAGATSVSAGTLALGVKGAITNSSGVFLGSNTTFDVSAVTGGFSLGLAKAQTLSGFGSVVGSVTITNNGTLSPGHSVGSLVFSNNLTLSGTTFMELDKLAAAGSNDFVNVLGTLTLGGALTVTNIGAALASGDTFNLFDAPTFANSFAALNLQSPGSGLVWDTRQLNSQGILAVVAVPEPGTLLLGLGGLLLLPSLVRRTNDPREPKS